MKERQAWCCLQVKLCDPCLSALCVPWCNKALYKYSSFPFRTTSRTRLLVNRRPAKWRAVRRPSTTRQRSTRDRAIYCRQKSHRRFAVGSSRRRDRESNLVGREISRAPRRGHIRPGGVTLLTPSGELRRHRRQPRRKQFAPPPLSVGSIENALDPPARNIARRAREIVFVNTPLWRRVATFASTQSSQNVHSTF